MVKLNVQGEWLVLTYGDQDLKFGLRLTDIDVFWEAATNDGTIITFKIKNGDTYNARGISFARFRECLDAGLAGVDPSAEEEPHEQPALLGMPPSQEANGSEAAIE